MSYVFNASEWTWIARRADQICRETSEPLPVARLTAMAQLAGLRGLPKADVLPISHFCDLHDERYPGNGKCTQCAADQAFADSQHQEQ